MKNITIGSVLTIFSFFLFSCSNDDFDKQITENNLKSYTVSSENDFIDYSEDIKKYLKSFNPSDPGGGLWKPGFNYPPATTGEPIYTAKGYDQRKVLNKFLTTFDFPFNDRITIGHPYYTESVEYTKFIEVTKGYSVVIPPGKPPISIMSGLLEPLNMGYVPGTYETGYEIRYVSSTSNKDKYALVTNVLEYSKNERTGQRLNPPVYSPYDVTNPSNFEFKYKLVNSSWD